MGMAQGSADVTGEEQPPPAETLSVTQVVMAILEARKTMPWATAAAISRETHRDQVCVRVRLLDRSSDDLSQGHGEVVAVFTVRQLGEDLAAAFGQKDVIILK